MSNFDENIKENNAIILYNDKLGYIRAWAKEDMPGLGQSALFEVTVNSGNLPGISAMTVNLNSWDVYHEDDPEILAKIRDKFLPRGITR